MRQKRSSLDASELPPGFGVVLRSHWGRIGVALVWLWWRFGVALGWLWGPNRLAISRLWCGFMMALGCLCTPEYMPSICLLYGLSLIHISEPTRQAEISY